jgi:hypothetical protein
MAWRCWRCIPGLVLLAWLAGCGPQEATPGPAEADRQALQEGLQSFTSVSPDGGAATANTLAPFGFGPGAFFVEHGGTGRYFVGVGRNLSGTQMQVVALGTDNARCGLDIDAWSNPFGIPVRCTTPAGAPVDSGFVAQLAKASTGNGVGAYAWIASPGNTAYRTWNSTGGPVTVSHPGPGVYRVVLGGLGNGARGWAQVTAVSSAGRHCTLLDVAPSGADQVATVVCYAPGAPGVAADSDFTLNYGGPGMVSAHDYGGYAVVTAPTASGAPERGYNSGKQRPGPLCPAGAVTQTWLGPGLTSVLFRALDPSPGAVHVTSRGFQGEYCKAQYWGRAAKSGAGFSDTRVQVACFGADGAPRDTPYSLSFGTSLARLACPPLFP